MSLPPQIEEQVRDMPMLNEVANRLLTILGDERHTVRNVVEVIETDVYMSSRLMRIANSAAFSRGHEITSIQRAVVHVGESLVLGIAIGASTGELLTQPLAGYDGPEGAMWKHSLQVAFAARELALRSGGRVQPEHAYTAGLLMDIGMTVMSEHMAAHSENIIRRIDSGEEADFTEFEREAVGVDHAEVGSELAKRWNLPESLVVGIRDHHHPSKAPVQHRPLVYTLHIADMLARLAGFGVGSESLSYTLDAGYEEYYKISSRDLSELILVVLEEYSKVEQSLFS